MSPIALRNSPPHFAIPRHHGGPVRSAIGSGARSSGGETSAAWHREVTTLKLAPGDEPGSDPETKRPPAVEE